MDITFDRANRQIIAVEKVFLTKEERAALQSIINLDPELRLIVEDVQRFVNYGSWNPDITENGYLWNNKRWPIVWLNSPTDCRYHIGADPKNELSLVFRSPRLQAKIKYDFPRVLISKKMG